MFVIVTATTAAAAAAAAEGRGAAEAAGGDVEGGDAEVGGHELQARARAPVYKFRVGQRVTYQRIPRWPSSAAASGNSSSSTAATLVLRSSEISLLARAFFSSEIALLKLFVSSFVCGVVV